MTNKTTDLESDDYLTAWAKEVAAAVTPAELAKLVKDYRELASNPRRSADDRTFADRRAKALAKHKKRNS